MSEVGGHPLPSARASMSMLAVRVEGAMAAHSFGDARTVVFVCVGGGTCVSVNVGVGVCHFECVSV